MSEVIVETTSYEESQESKNNANDATFVLTTSFLIFTMQSGYGLLESGIVSRKNEINILIKNATNVLLGGLTFWMLGYGLAFGRKSSPFIAYSDFVTYATEQDMGLIYSKLIFQLAYATSSSTFISGAMAERCKFTGYCAFCILVTLIYSVPAGWMWRANGFLAELGAVDVGGSGVVHLVGGCSALMASIILGPRTGRYDKGTRPLPLGNPTNALLGLFMLWWGWLGFSAGSTFGIVKEKWQYASRASVTTILASMGGGFIGMVFSFITKKGIHDVSILIDAVIGSLVAVSGGALIFRPWVSIVVGCLAAAIVLMSIPLIDRLRIDDPTNTFAVHGVAGLWGLLAIGLFAETDHIRDYTHSKSGLLMGGGGALLTSQSIAIGCLVCWSVVLATISLFLIKFTLGLRMTIEEEILGTDFADHDLHHSGNAAVIRALAKQAAAVHNRKSIGTAFKDNFNSRRRRFRSIVAPENQQTAEPKGAIFN